MDIDKVIEKRHSSRIFTKYSKANYKKIIEAIYSGTLGPLAGNYPAIKFILIDNRDKINELAEAAQQSFIKQADFVVAVLSDRKQLKRAYGNRGEIYARQEAGAAIENFLLKLEDLKLSTCWVGAFDDNSVERILGLSNKKRDNEDIVVEAFFPIGKEKASKKNRKKPEIDSVLFFNEYGNKFMKEKDKPYV